MATGQGPGINQVPHVPLSRAGHDSGLSGGSLMGIRGRGGTCLQRLEGMWREEGVEAEAWQELGWAFARSGGRKAGDRGGSRREGWGSAPAASRPGAIQPHTAPPPPSLSRPTCAQPGAPASGQGECRTWALSEPGPKGQTASGYPHCASQPALRGMVSGWRSSGQEREGKAPRATLTGGTVTPMWAEMLKPESAPLPRQGAARPPVLAPTCHLPTGHAPWPGGQE